MVLGMSLATFTALHVVISLIAIATGLVVAAGMLSGSRLPGWTAVFLVTTVLDQRDRIPLSLYAGAAVPHRRRHLAGGAPLALVALYGKGLAGSWRWRLRDRLDLRPLPERLRPRGPGVPEDPRPEPARADRDRAAVPIAQLWSWRSSSGWASWPSGDSTRRRRGRSSAPVAARPSRPVFRSGRSRSRRPEAPDRSRGRRSVRILAKTLKQRRLADRSAGPPPPVGAGGDRSRQGPRSALAGSSRRTDQARPDQAGRSPRDDPLRGGPTSVKILGQPRHASRTRSTLVSAVLSPRRPDRHPHGKDRGFT